MMRQNPNGPMTAEAVFILIHYSSYETVQARASVAQILSKYKPIRHIPGHIPHLAFGLQTPYPLESRFQVDTRFIDPYIQPRLTEMFSELNAIAEHNRKKF